MSDNVLQTIQTILQDVIAPDVRETKARLEALQQEMTLRFEAMQKLMDARFEAMQQQIDTRFEATQQQISTRFQAVDERFKALEGQIEFRVGGLERSFETHVNGMNTQMGYLEKHLLSAFAQSQMQTEISGTKAIVDLRERVAVLESRAA